MSMESFHSSHLCINDATTTRLPFSLRHSHGVSTPETRRGNPNFVWNGERHWNTHSVINANFSKLIAALVMDVFLQLPFPHIIINENYTQSFLKKQFSFAIFKKKVPTKFSLVHYFSPNFFQDQHILNFKVMFEYGLWEPKIKGQEIYRRRMFL